MKKKYLFKGVFGFKKNIRIFFLFISNQNFEDYILKYNRIQIIQHIIIFNDYIIILVYIKTLYYFSFDIYRLKSIIV